MPAFLVIPLLTSLRWLWTCAFAIPVWLLWTICGLGTRYFAFLPAAWQSVPVLHVMGLFLLVDIARTSASSVNFDIKAKSQTR